MGCLKNITQAIFLTIIITGFIALGGQRWLKDQFINFVNPSKDVVLERAQKVGDFSKINKEFEIEKAAGILGYNAVLAEHKASGQKMFVIDTGKKEIITQNDLLSDNIEEKLLNTAHKFKYQSISAEDIKVVKKGSINTFNQDAPYIRFNARVSKLPMGEISGIISVVKNNDGAARTLISVNEKNKYSQLISDEFFRKIK